MAAISNQLISSLTSLLRCAAPLPRQGAFRCFASLGANDEDIRKRIIEMDGLMEEVLAGLGDPCPEVSLNYFIQFMMLILFSCRYVYQLFDVYTRCRVQCSSCGRHFK